MMQKIMSYGFVAFLFVVAAALFFHPRLQAQQGTIRVAEVTQADQERIKWVADSLMEMKTIKAGMTRADLLKVFTTEGGLSSVEWRKYVYRGCPYFKVDIKFSPVKQANPVRNKQGEVIPMEDPRDVITSISQPYLEFTISR